MYLIYKEHESNQNVNPARWNNTKKSGEIMHSASWESSALNVNIKIYLFTNIKFTDFDTKHEHIYPPTKYLFKQDAWKQNKAI